MHAEAVLADALHELDHLSGIDEEVAAILDRVGLDAQPHAPVGGDRAQFAKEGHGDRLGLQPSERSSTAVLRRPKHEPLRPEAGCQVDDRHQLLPEQPAGRRIAEEHEIRPAEEQRLQRHDRQAAILPKPAVGHDALGRRLPGTITDPRRRHLDAGRAVGDEHGRRFGIGVSGPGDVRDG